MEDWEFNPGDGGWCRLRDATEREDPLLSFELCREIEPQEELSLAFRAKDSFRFL
jgi:hypothetical protein